MRIWICWALLLAGTVSTAAENAAEQAIVDLYAAYRSAWLANDPDSTPQDVIALFTDDAALLPHHGDPIVTPRAAISAHWFPDGVLYGEVVDYTQDVRRVEVHGKLAYLYARFSLTFESQGRRRTNAGNQLMIARREEGLWKIAALMWNDPLPTDVVQ